VQWYGNVPAVGNVNENCPPGATIPESHPFAFDVDVWATESVFIHVTVAPTATFKSSGVKARFPSVEAPTGIVTDDDGPPGVGTGDGVGEGEVGDDELPLPQAIANIKGADMTARRKKDIGSSNMTRVETRVYARGGNEQLRPGA